MFLYKRLGVFFLHRIFAPNFLRLNALRCKKVFYTVT